MVESRAVSLDGLTSGGHGSRIVNPQRAQAASEKGAAYERLGFPANQKRVCHRILSFFSRRLLLKQKKKAEGTLRNPDFQVARRGLPAQTRMSTLFAGFAFDKMDFSDGFSGNSWRAYGTRPGM